MSSRNRKPRPGILVASTFTILFVVLTLGTVFGAAAQVLPVRAQPTATASPTALPVRANPTQPPEIDDIQGNPTAPPTHEPMDDLVANPTPRPTDEPIDDDVANPTETPGTDDEAIPLAGTVRVVTRDCPAGVVDDATLSEYLTICAQQHDGVEFILNDVDGAQAGVTASGQVEWTGVDPGGFNITETLPAGYGNPIVFCGYTESPGGGVQHPALQSSTGGIVTGTFPDAMFEFVCYWMNVPAEPGFGGPGSATFRVITHRCPPGVPEDATFDQYVVICAEPFDGVSFTLEHAGGSFPAETGGDGQAEWVDVPPGDVELQETLPAGFTNPLAFCGTFAGEGELGFSQIQAEGGTVPLTIPDGATNVTCWLFNIQDPDAGSTVMVVKKSCPAGIAVGTNDIGDFHATCGSEHPGVEFTLESGGGVTSTTVTNANGAIEWAGVPTGDFSIQETIPDGFGDPVVFCNFGDVIQGLPFADGPPTLVAAPGGLVAATILEPNTTYLCYYFNIQDEAPDSRVVVNKRICDPGVDLVLTDDNVINDIITACPTFGEGIEFTLEHAEGSSTQAIVDDATFWDGVPPGPFTVTEHVPAGYGEPVWYCTTNPKDENGDVQVSGVWTLGNAPGGVLSETIDEPHGEVFACWVFNVPADEEENSVTLFKWRCPEGTGYEEDQDWYEGNCVEQHDGVEFAVASDIGIAVLETAGGTVQFDGLPAGTVGIQETIPAEYGPPVVFCATDAGWATYPAPTGHWDFEFEDDGQNQALVCHVYNIPGEPGSLTLLKWTCPPGYDLDAAGADPQLDCTEAANGIEFQFGLASGLEAEAELQTTGDLIDGGVIFDDLEPDTWKASELVPDGIAEVFVLECTGHIMGVLQPYPLHMGSVLEIEIDAGEHLTCHWYNVPETEGGSLTVIKYACATETFVSEVDCQIYEGGKTFDLLHWNVDDGVWEVIDTGVTDGVGQIVWTGLGAGDYGLDEHGGVWCRLTTSPVFGPGEFFSVLENEETTVSVYNCDGRSGEPGDTPTKYPNTGTGPTGLEPWRETP